VKSVDFKAPVVPKSKQENAKKTERRRNNPKNQLQIKIHKLYPIL
jgi:hypothetical protein